MGLNNGTKAESWEISQRNGKPGIFTRNGKEWSTPTKRGLLSLANIIFSREWTQTQTRESRSQPRRAESG